MLEDRELTKMSYLGYIFGLSCDSFGFSFGLSCDMGYILRLSFDSFGFIFVSRRMKLGYLASVTVTAEELEEGIADSTKVPVRYPPAAEENRVKLSQVWVKL